MPSTPVGWRDSVLAAVRRSASRSSNGVISRQQLIDEEMGQVREETRTRGATTDQKLSRVLQDLAHDGLIEFLGSGSYRLVESSTNTDGPLASEESALSALGRKELEVALEHEMRGLSDKAAALRPRLRFPYFVAMMAENGGLRTAQFLLDKADVSDGFTRLWEHGIDSGSNDALHLAVEYVVLQGPWRALFTSAQLDVARKRLRDVGCDVPTEDLPALRSPSATARSRGVAPPRSPGGPTTGPVPSSWTATVQRSVGREAFVYVMQFGMRNVWKIGHSQDVAERLIDVNKHVPNEVLGENWHVYVTTQCVDPSAAYVVEQALLTRLSEFRSIGERVCCTQEALDEALEGIYGG